MNAKNVSISERLVFELRQWPLLVVLAASILLAILIPPSVLQDIPGLSSLLHVLVENIPATRDYVRSSQFPDVAAVYFPFMVLLSPLLFLYGLRITPRGFWDEQFAQKPLVATFRLLVALLITVFVGYGSFVEGGGQLNIIPWNDSRIALGLAGFVVCGGAFFMLLASLVFGVKAFLTRIGAQNG